MSTLLIALCLAADIFVVDDDGPADFTEIQAAVDAAHAGDTLLVRVGDYDGFTLSKRLTILGQDGPAEPGVGTRPFVGGPTRVAGVATVTLAGLQLSGLELDDITASAVVDDCSVIGRVEVDGCHQLVMSRLSIPFAGADQVALRVDASRMTLVDATLVGGPGSPVSTQGMDGQPALQVVGGSFVVVAGSSLTGGISGEGFFVDGAAGDALSCSDSTVIVRGSSGDAFDAGHYEPGFGTHGYAIRCTGGTVLHSGVTLDAQVLTEAGGVVLTPDTAEPYLEITGTGAFGDEFSLDHYGAAGSTTWLLIGTGAGDVALPKLEHALWLDPGALLLVTPVALLGQDTPVSLLASLPDEPGLAGFTLFAQAVSPQLPSTLVPGAQVVSNVAPLLLRR